MLWHGFSFGKNAGSQNNFIFAKVSLESPPLRLATKRCKFFLRKTHKNKKG